MESNLTFIVLIIFINPEKIANTLPKNVIKQIEISINLDIKSIQYLYKLYSLYHFDCFCGILYL